MACLYLHASGHTGLAGTLTGRWEHFRHDADIGVRGVGDTLEEAFAEAALAMTAVITAPEKVQPDIPVDITCAAPDTEILLADWLNALVLEMAARNMLFGRFEVAVRGTRLTGRAWGEAVDRARHRPVVEVKGATYTGLSVRREGDRWIAETVLDV